MTPEDGVPYSSVELAREAAPRARAVAGVRVHSAPTSSVRVFAKSMYGLAAGWLLSVLWIWAAGVRQHVVRQGVAPDNFNAGILFTGLTSTAVLAIVAVALVRWTGPAPHPHLERREWHHAFWWSAVPNLLLLGTAYLMILAAV
jgi:hypothetical protein